MIPAIKDLPVSRLASAAGALVITSVILLALGLGFPSRATAQAVSAGAVKVTNATPLAGSAALGASARTGASVERGRYVVSISGCNDCHTAGYAENGGKTPQADWLTGLPVGFRGPWGVSYPANLRLTVQKMTEAQWLPFARAERLPPMPWFSLRDMSDDDLRSVYRFIRVLGPKGAPMPAAAGPSANVATPFIQFTPQNLPAAVTQAAPAKQGGRG